MQRRFKSVTVFCRGECKKALLRWQQGNAWAAGAAGHLLAVQRLSQLLTVLCHCTLL